MATVPAPAHIDAPHPVVSPPIDEAEAVPDRISAYYSLVFPNFTYYLQTLTVTIGRRCIPTSTASSSDNRQVDVDLGPLKSVSRLHAKIEYDEDEERFVLLVIGRNGAWVDGVWSGSGSKVPLSDRSQIQIASRTFHFILPPPAPPEDSPSPSSQSSGNRLRSPSVDITSYSPPTSPPSCSPPPSVPAAAAPKVAPLAEASLPNSNQIKTNPKKRKKQDAPAPALMPPEVMPPKPPFTYAQLCYRAIKALGGKASLQEICQWVKDTYDYYKYCSKDWESSVRHNLSSNPGFKKLLRSKDEKGKGALWTVDEAHEHTFEEMDARKQANIVGGNGVMNGKKGKAATTLEPALKRSVKGDPKGAPLPPPLTSTPLPMKTSVIMATKVATAPPVPMSGFSSSHPPIKAEPVTVAHVPPAHSQSPPAGPSPVATHPSGQVQVSQPGITPSVPASAPTAFPAIPATVRIPIIVGPVPTAQPLNGPAPPPKPIVLHENTLILNPEIFSTVSPQRLQDLEALGAQKALEILQSYIVLYYKEKLKAEGGRGRGRGRGKRARGAASVGVGRGVPPNDSTASGPFTTAPLPARPANLPPATSSSAAGGQAAPPPSQPFTDREPSPIVVVDDDSPVEEPEPKRRRLDSEPDIDITAD